MKKCPSNFTHIAFTRNGKVVYRPLDAKGRLINKEICLPDRSGAAKSPAAQMLQKALPPRQDFFPETASASSGGLLSAEPAPVDSVFQMDRFLDSLFQEEPGENLFPVDPLPTLDHWGDPGLLRRTGGAILDPFNWLFSVPFD
jgi:hypothetical protein